MKVGDLVVCTYRVPSANQWWTQPFHVGVIQDVEDVDALKASDARYCAVHGYVKVQYMPGVWRGNGDQGFTQLDSLANLLPLHWSEGLRFSPYFGDGDHAALVEFASKCGLADYYRESAAA